MQKEGGRTSDTASRPTRTHRARQEACHASADEQLSQLLWLLDAQSLKVGEHFYRRLLVVLLLHERGHSTLHQCRGGLRRLLLGRRRGGTKTNAATAGLLLPACRRPPSSLFRFALRRTHAANGSAIMISCVHLHSVHAKWLKNACVTGRGTSLALSATHGEEAADFRRGRQ